MMRTWIVCCLAALAMAGQPLGWADSQTGGAQQGPSKSGAASAANPSSTEKANAPADTPMSDEDKANLLSDQVGKLMVKCVNLLTAGDPLSLDYCKQQRDLADQYPPELRVMDRLLAHDEYGIALAAFDHKREALEEFNREILLLPKVVKPGTTEWSTAYWHRAMIYSQLDDDLRADRDYSEAENSCRKQERDQGAQHPDKKMRSILRQHAALLKKEGKTDASEKLLAEAAK